MSQHEGAPRPTLPAEVERHRSATDLEGLWDRFEIFEALHHSQTICNPMTEAELDRLLELLDPAPGRSILDVACGPGELLIRSHELGADTTTGIDLSPWMLTSAANRAADRLGSGPRPSWVLGDGAKVVIEDPTDRVVCLGGEWIWRGMHGTIAALTDRVAVGGRVTYGGPRLNFGADPDTVTAEFGKLDTIADVEARMAACGLRIVERIDPGDAGWLAYLDRGDACAEAWAERYPGDRSERWVDEQAEWRELYERDRAVVGWSVWIADRT